MSSNTQTSVSQEDRDSAGLYDMIMQLIEPDLVTVQIPLLPIKYKDETREEHAARMERYDNAFQKFDEIFAEVMDERTQQLKSVEQTMRAEVQRQEAEEKKTEIAEAEKLLDDNSASA